MSDRRWLHGSSDPVEAELRRMLDSAAVRTGDDVTLRRVWSKLPQAPLSPLMVPMRDGMRGLARRWFVGGAASGVVAAAVLAVCFWPARAPLAPAASVAAGRPAVGVAASVAAAPASTRASVPVSARTSAPVTVSLAAPASARQLIVGPTSVHAAANETLALALTGGAAVSVGPGAVLTLDAHQRPSVDAGEVSFSVPHQPPGETFVVTVGSYQVVVIGTRFRVRNGERVSVDVDEGVVEVRRGSQRLARLAVGESWSGGALVVAAPAPAAPEDVVVRPPPSRRAWKQLRRVRKPRAVVASASPSASRKVILAPLDLAADRPGTDAEKALASGDVRRSLEIYGEILSRGGPAAENAAYEIGKILRDRLHQPEAAVAAWRRYRGSHPDGLLRAEADVSIVETLLQLGDRPGALAEAVEFLRRHPGSERRGEIARVTGDLQRAAGDCRAALASYALVPPRASRADVAAQAAAGRAACQEKLAAGDHARARP